MSATASQSTLRYHTSRPLGLARNTQHVPMNVFSAKSVSNFKWFGDHTCMGKHPEAPETAALKFYLMEHAVAEIRLSYGLDTPLPSPQREVVEAFHRTCNPLAARMIYYVWAICLRESRHKHWTHEKREKFLKGLAVDAKKMKIHPLMAAKLCEYWFKIPASESEGVKYVLSHPPEDVNLGMFCKALVRVFMNGGYGSAFGGKKWKIIAIALDEYVSGKISAALFLDRAFNLAHNTAPIFNKGMLFDCQSGHGTTLKMFLDIQAAGQIPQFINDPCGSAEGKITHEVNQLHELVMAAMGETFADEVDWVRVKHNSKGGVSYQHLINSQKKPSTYATDAEALAKKKAVNFAKKHYIVDHKTTLTKCLRPV